MYRTIGKTRLTWAELEEVSLDIEIILSKKPLTYIEEKIVYPILTPNSLILGSDVSFSDVAPHKSESGTMKKQLKYTKQCKETLWKRWKREYLVALRQEHNLKHKDKTFKINFRWRSHVQRGKEKSRALEYRHCKPTVY